MRAHKGPGYTFAVLLILFGSVLLLEQLGFWEIPWRQIWSLWPLVLVLIGLEILLRRVPGGGWLFFIAACGIIALVIGIWPNLKVARIPSETHTVDYPLTGVRSAEMHITLGVGNLEIGTLQEDDLLYKATLYADPQRTDLAAANTVEGTQATVALRLVSLGQRGLISHENERLAIDISPQIPVALSITGGVSRSRLDLTGLNLSRLELNAGVGETWLALPPGDYAAVIKGSVGKISIHIPSQAGARIEVQKGLGTVHIADRFRQEGNAYTVQGAGEIHLRIEGGVGAIEID